MKGSSDSGGPESDEAKSHPDGKEPLHWTPQGMVGWYDPRQLLKTGVRIATTSLFAKNADSRLLQPLFDPGPSAHTVGGTGEDLSIDYIADTGDGFNSSYAVAYWATQPDLPLVGPKRFGARGKVLVNGKEFDGALDSTSPGRILIMGGDQVYPTGSEEEYRARLEVPFELASINLKAEHRQVFAIPGNHDWYENLVAFHQIFMRQKLFGTWRTEQRRSYFAIRLPYNWWLLGTDMQLGSDMDPVQDEFFRGLKIPETDSVIMCHAEPHWVYEGEEARKTSKVPKPMTRVRALEQSLGDRLRLVMAGDLHHYRRHVAFRDLRGTAERHFVTAGGGGAFLHPTHFWRDVDRKGNRPTLLDGRHVRLVASYPSKSASFRVSLKCLLCFPFTNGWFLAASSIVYGLVSLTFLSNARAVIASDPQSCSNFAWTSALSPSVVVWLALMLAAFVAFTDTSARWYRWVGGLGHSAAHIFASIFFPWLAVRLIGPSFATGAEWWLIAFLGTTILGGFAGAVIMGGYLFVSLSVFGRHRNETFSAIREEGFKNFLRLKLSRDGVNVTAFGIQKVPEWAVPRNGTVRRKRIEPKKPIRTDDDTHPFVIEQFDVSPNPQRKAPEEPRPKEEIP